MLAFLHLIASDYTLGLSTLDLGSWLNVQTQPIVITRSNYMQHITGKMHHWKMHQVEDSH